MTSRLLRIYLQDHHAASAGGVALARRALGPSHPLAKQIARDRDALERVMHRLAVTPSALKVGIVRAAELVGRMKLNGRIFGRSPLSSVVELETLVVGVRGKEALWTALQRAGISLEDVGVDAAARALTGYLLVRGGVHQVAYARALERLTGADLMKLFPSPRIPTEKIPDCKPYIDRGEHLRLYRFSPDDYLELEAVWNGPHPETEEELEVVDEAPEGAPAFDLPSQPAVFAPDYAPEEIAEIAEKLRVKAGLSKEPTGEVANGNAVRSSKPRRAPRKKAAAK